jgi:membrane fusion protein (multidrug efflux system)
VTQEVTPQIEHKARLPFSKKLLMTVVLPIGLVAVAGYFGNQALRYMFTHEDTDDAYITGHLHQVSTRVNGTVERVLVDDNEHVREGQVIVLLDQRDYKAKADEALANLEQAQRQAKSAQTTISYQDVTAQGQDTNARGTVDNALAAISRSKAQVREASAKVESAQSTLGAKEAELERSLLDYKRFFKLEAEGAISTSQRDAAKRDYLVALDSRNAAKHDIAQAEQQMEEAQQSVRTSQADLTKAEALTQLAKASAVQTKVTQDQYQTNLAAVAAAKASLDEAMLNLSYTRIVAPTSGRVGKKTVEEGARIEPGQPLMTITSDDRWVVANYKETQLKKMHAGQVVDIKIDAFPDHTFQGIVQSFSPASGASFAVLPSDNATGNFTKIVQRLPVKILFTTASLRGYEDRLAPGLSVITSVDVSNHVTTQLAALK